MKCCVANQSDCRHLMKNPECWYCAFHGRVTIDPMMDACSDYEAPGDYDILVALRKELDNHERTFKEFDEWRDHCIRLGVKGVIVVLIAYAAFVWWMLT